MKRITRIRNLKSEIRHGATAPAFTLAEAVVSTAIVAVMFVAALNTVGTSRVAQHKNAMAGRGQLFAQALMAEILQQDYKDAGSSPVFGLESGESNATRADFDDVDDYTGWTASPPTAKDGTALANSTDWRHTVTVEWINRLNPAQVETTETGAKRIRVTLSCHNVPQASLVAIRTAY